MSAPAPVVIAPHRIEVEAGHSWASLWRLRLRAHCTVCDGHWGRYRPDETDALRATLFTLRRLPCPGSSRVRQHREKVEQAKGRRLGAYARLLPVIREASKASRQEQ